MAFGFEDTRGAAFELAASAEAVTVPAIICRRESLCSMALIKKKAAKRTATPGSAPLLS
jgi:hypothetical protein